MEAKEEEASWSWGTPGETRTTSSPSEEHPLPLPPDRWTVGSRTTLLLRLGRRTSPALDDAAFDAHATDASVVRTTVAEDAADIAAVGVAAAVWVGHSTSAGASVSMMSVAGLVLVAVVAVAAGVVAAAALAVGAAVGAAAVEEDTVMESGTF